MSKSGRCTMEHRTLVYPRGIVWPEDLVSFVQLRPFTKHWKSLNLTDDDLRHLEMQLMVNPSAGQVIPGTGGLRKLRAAPASWNTGKRGALRICYVYFSDLFIIVLAVAYGKNRKDNLTQEEKAVMRKIIPAIHKEFSKERNSKDAQ